MPGCPPGLTGGVRRRSGGARLTAAVDRGGNVKAVVVYESLWGNTAAVARAVAAGIGAEARALSTAEATPEALAGADLIVAGGPVLGFKLSSQKMRDGIAKNPPKGPAPDLSQPLLRTW